MQEEKSFLAHQPGYKEGEASSNPVAWKKSSYGFVVYLRRKVQVHPHSVLFSKLNILPLRLSLSILASDQEQEMAQD